MGALHELLTDRRAVTATEYAILLAAAAVFVLTLSQVFAQAIGVLMALVPAAAG